MPITGQPIFAARSMILHIFSAMTSPSEPPNTVKSWLNTHTRRPSIVAVPGDDRVAVGRFFCMSNSYVRWRMNTSSSWNEPGSSSFSTRSRAVYLPRSCCLATACSGAGVDRLVAELLESPELLGVGLGSFVAHRVGEFRGSMGYRAAARCDTTSPSCRNRRSRADDGRHRSRIAAPSVAGERRTQQRPTGRRGESPQVCGVAHVASPSANSAGSRRRRQLVDFARDLSCAELWQASLERSLARRGRPTRSSLELFHLRPERDLSRVERSP